jgi:transcriptional regulator with XRE-family HTH domain
LTARPSAFGRALAVERKRLRMKRQPFADLLGVTDWMLQQWEYGRRGISSVRAARLARTLKLPAWHFEQALAEDRMAATCYAREVTAIVVGLATYLERVLPGPEWAAARAKILEGG